MMTGDLSNHITEVIQKSGAKIGVALRHIESGEEIKINAEDYYPLASVMKIPILAEACHQMALGKFTPADRWALKTEDKNLPSGVLTFFEDGLTPSVNDILTMMIIISDNTATDIMIKRLGKDAINQYMESLGLYHTHIRMTVRELFEQIMPNADPTQDLYEVAAADKQRGSRKETLAYRLTPENNVATPTDMTGLLCQIFAGKTPDRKWSDFALKILLLQQLNDRMPRFLPAGTRCAHKTGTIDGVRNDSGIIYAGENSHVALTMFATWDEEAVEDDARLDRQRSFEIDSAMGEIALMAFEAYR
ncbi:MAG: class A beta-lactamase-related serine hydrolase [Anaerolineaceae bacterium]|nr:class A beta-lactamase-related serine hydrolase [Anaerolineaceae bacterium]